MTEAISLPEIFKILLLCDLTKEALIMLLF